MRRWVRNSAICTVDSVAGVGTIDSRVLPARMPLPPSRFGTNSSVDLFASDSFVAILSSDASVHSTSIVAHSGL